MELEAERAKAHAEPVSFKADETLRDTAPVLEGIKVMSLNMKIWQEEE